MSLFEELKRRNVFRVAVAYVVVGWLLAQVADLMLETFGAPGWVMKTFLGFLAIGFPLALFFAWAYEMTPEGIKKEENVDRSRSITHETGRKLDRMIIVILAVAVVFLLAERVTTAPEPEKAAATPGAAAPKAGAKLPGPEPADAEQSIAVLPFVNMSSDPEQEYFSDGLAEELLNRLAQNSELRVAARTSAFQFKGKNVDISEIGRELKVANVLEGSVRKSGNRVRITAQLIRVDNGFHLWSETFEREMTDIFAIQDDISTAIAKALEVQLGATTRPDHSKPTENLEAYNVYLQARYYLARRGEKNMRKADALFARAVDLDPGFSLAWSGKAFNSTLLWGYSLDMPLSESYEKTMFAANKAIELDPANAEAYAAMGRTEADAYNWQRARESFERAYRLQPNSVNVLNLYSDFETTVGDFDEAIRIKEQAVRLDPLSAVLISDLAEWMLLVNRNDEALASARKAVSLAPYSYARKNVLLMALVKTGAFDEARALIDRSAASSTTDPREKAYIVEWRALYFHQNNDADALSKLLAEHARIKDNEPESKTLDAGEVAFYTLWLDGVDAALPYLQEAYKEKAGTLINPEYFYLPERMSDDTAWLQFWSQPGLSELLETRRVHPYTNVSFWKERPAS